MSLPSLSDNAQCAVTTLFRVNYDDATSGDKSDIPIQLPVKDENITENSKCSESEFPEDSNSNPSKSSNPIDRANSQEQAPPPLTKTINLESNSDDDDDCILIPKHAVVDDISLKFILHPNLPSKLTPWIGCKDSESKGVVKAPSSTVTTEELDIPRTKTGTRKSKALPQKNTKNSITPPGEQYVIKTAKEILYDIAQGRWNRRGMIIDEEAQGTKKVGSRPCSNANCVRAAERERCMKEKLPFQNLNDAGIIFQDGNLPSYHSLLNMWKSEAEAKQRHFWTRNAFKKGFPDNDNEFLKVWRECRKNPQAFGVKISKPEELPDVLAKPQGLSAKSYDKTSLSGEAIGKYQQPPIRLASKEYYNTDLKPAKSFRERTKQKRRYEELRKLYPHLPPLRDVDYRMSPATVKYRMRQAEEWHELVTASNKPSPNTALSHYSTDINYTPVEYTATGECECYPQSVESSDYEIGGERK